MNKDIELQVWKDLATSKQVLMTAVIEALELDPNGTPGDLRLAINLLKERANEAEKQSAHLESGQEHLNRVIEEKDEQIESLLLAEITANTKLENAKDANTDDLRKCAQLVNQKQRELKAINKILSDSPENVVKKMKKMKQKNIEQAKYVKEVEKNFKDAVLMCERLREDIEERVAEKKKLEAQINKLTPIKTETN